MLSVNKIIEMDSDDDDVMQQAEGAYMGKANSDSELYRDGGGPSRLLTEAELKTGLKSLLSAKKRDMKRSVPGQPFVTVRKHGEREK